MNKELFEKLFDAGFPSIQHYGRYSSHDSAVWPSLSELIEACGDEFCQLLRIVGNPDDGWQAQNKNRDCFNGATPEEAVAHLYLALHRDKAKEGTI